MSSPAGASADREIAGAKLRVERITKKFGGLTAVSDFSVTLEPGEIVGLIGPNGAGKTTVFNLITGVYKPDSGSITLDTTDLQALTPDRVTSCGVARTFQNIRLFKEMTVLENVMVGFQTQARTNLFSTVMRTPEYHREEAHIVERAQNLIKLLGLDQKAQQFSRNLCYGDQRKLEIARALATGPRVLLLDEPAAGMNDSESEALRKLLFEIRERFSLTMLLIEHDMPFVMGLVNRLLVLDHGVTIGQGKPAEIRANPAVIEAYLGKDDHEN